jgi:hypothetical protein
VINKSFFTMLCTLSQCEAVFQFAKYFEIILVENVNAST